ncbi:hypothetical protein DSM03_1062 [Leeuwenhoekiella aestuarii]|uniref:Uncharacterized protein n=1 Tax=Leeuwenhoekiella aestuarii TaxID=2249426 RepID=A0A4Q0NPG4_9FLAO|nr:hypothetical protein DSM04_1072 [Leeuwenhoekiella aestuarii]RXG13670.1 hypothetical protein DSM03_1062 [Leeuwenhoekiella aestuarii]
MINYFFYFFLIFVLSISLEGLSSIFRAAIASHVIFSHTILSIFYNTITAKTPIYFMGEEESFEISQRIFIEDFKFRVFINSVKLSLF